MKKDHLKLVISNNIEASQSLTTIDFNSNCNQKSKALVISQKEKIYMLKDSLIKLYRDYEITTGICEVPYNVRAEIKISEIIHANQVDYYFEILEKIRKKSMYLK